MRQNLALAAAHFGLTVASEPTFGWRIRSVGAAAQDSDGRRFWLRVVSEYVEWAGGDIWTGNLDANVITGVAKPLVIGVVEWGDDGWRRQRAELSTLVRGRPCSPTDVLHQDINLPDGWWSELRRTVETVSRIPTERMSISQEKITQRIRSAFGDDIDSMVLQWRTVHGDLHWSNLVAPAFGILDWELWGRGPACLDAATLYCFSLLTPGTANRVREVFGDHLDSPSGRLAQIYVAARLLNRSAQGDFAELAAPLRSHVRALVEDMR
jgi:hypothetical protein